MLRRVSLKNRRLKFLSWLVRGKGIQMLVDYSTLKNSENFHSKRNISPNTGDRDLVTLVLVHPVYHSPPLSPTVFCMRNKSAFQMHPPRTDNLIRGGKVFAFSAGKIFSLVPSYLVPTRLKIYRISRWTRTWLLCHEPSEYTLFNYNLSRGYLTKDEIF